MTVEAGEREARAAPGIERDGGRLPVGGIVPFSTVDYPGSLAAVVFLQGCPWRCGYCHNPHLQQAGRACEGSFEAFLRWLDTRRGLLDAVVFSGGEPTAHAALGAAMREVRDRGFAIGLHTGGAYPRRLEGLLEWVDWIGLDVKAPARDYARITGVGGSGAGAFACLRTIVAAGIPHEVRTTVHPALVTPAMLLSLAGELGAEGVRRWVLQPFRPDGCADAALVASAPRGATIDPRLVARLRERVPEVEVRG